MELNGPGTDATTKVCALCGRIGSRGFTVEPAGMLMLGDTTYLIGESVTCTNKAACRKRWPQEARDDD